MEALQNPGQQDPTVSPMEKAQAAATASAQRTLERAATFAGLHATAKPLFQKTMRVGSRSLLVRLVWPGVLLVCDPATGEVLAQSEPGQPAVLAAHFRALTEHDLAPRIS